MTELSVEYIRNEYEGLTMVDDSTDAVIQSGIDKAICVVLPFKKSFWKSSNCQYLQASSYLALHFMFERMLNIARMNQALTDPSSLTQQLSSMSADGVSESYGNRMDADKWVDKGEYSSTPYGIQYMEMRALVQPRTYLVC